MKNLVVTNALKQVIKSRSEFFVPARMIGSQKGDLLKFCRSRLSFPVSLNIVVSLTSLCVYFREMDAQRLLI